MKTSKPRSLTAVSAALGGLVLIGVLVTGCTSTQSGCRISNESTAFIEPGKTTRAEILANFGKPNVEVNEFRVIAYYWQTHRGVWQNNMRREETIIGLCDWAFCLRFDAQDRVASIVTLRTRGENSISEAVKHWAKARK